MLPRTEINRPKIDINNYIDSQNIPPILQVQVMESNAFEQFTLEWLYACRKDKYTSIVNIGGSGDKGRDVIGYLENGNIDYYQCKHYTTPLSPSDYYIEFGKLCYYTYIKEFPIPQNYYIVASNDLGPKLTSLLENNKQLVESLKTNWNKYCKNNITKSDSIELSDELQSYLDTFDFSICQHCPIQLVINEHIQSIYGTIRFGGVSVQSPTKITPPIIINKSNELTYVNELLNAYADALGVPELSLESLINYDKYYKNFNRQRKDYYSAETIRRFVRDTFTDTKQFSILEEEVYDGIIDVYEGDYINAYERLNNVMKQAAVINVDKSLLSSKIKCIGNSEKKGTCHILVNDDRLSWVKKDE